MTSRRLATALLLAACAAPRPERPTGEVPLADVARDPREFVGRTIVTRGWLVGGGQVPAGTWLELAVSPEALVRARTGLESPGGAGSPMSLVLVLPAATGHGVVEDLRTRELELTVRIDEEVVLPDGRRALGATPLQVATALEAPAPGTELPEPVKAQATAMMQALAAGEAELFGDPRLESGHTSQAQVRYTFLDAELERPRWRLPGPVTIERSGSAEAPRYRFASQTGADDGGVRQATCDFVVERGGLRSLAYHEVIRDAAGTVVEEQHLDFLGGQAMDKVSGRTFRWPRNIYAAPCLGFALMGYPFETKRTVSFFMWTEYDPFTTMYAILDGEEQVTVPAGTFECHRVRMNANLEHLIRSLELPTARAHDMAREAAERFRAPDTLLWFTRAHPHLFVKMAGPMGPPGTTRGVVEVTALDEGSRAALAAAARAAADQVWTAPERFAGRTVHLRFPVAAAGSSNGGRWLEAVPSDRGDRPRFFVPGAQALGVPGRDVELRARVGAVMSLDSGGRAVVLYPVSAEGATP